MQRHLRTIFLFLALASPLMAKSLFLYCHSADDYRFHMILHIERVKWIGLRILQDFPQHFPDVVPSHLYFALGEHDATKVDDMLSANQTVKWWELLYEYYGEDYKTMDRLRATAFIAMQGALNAADDKHFRESLYRRGIKEGSVVDQYLMLQRLADQFDRYLEHVVTPEEMGRALDIPPSEYQYPSKLFMAIARHYENLELSSTPWYQDVTAGLHYVSLRPQFKTDTMLNFLRCKNAVRIISLYSYFDSRLSVAR